MRDKSSLKVILNIFVKNHLRLINKKIVIANMILFALPLFAISYLMRNYNLGIKFIISLYVSSFILVYFKKVLTGLFIFDDYENYLGFPTSVKDVAISKFVVLNFDAGVQLAFLLLACIFDGLIQGKAIWYYPIIIISYFVVNFLLLSVSFLVILIYYMMKNFLVYSKISIFREIIENISKKEKTYRNKKYIKESKIRTLAMMDIKKVLRDKKLALGLGVNSGIMLIFIVVMTSLVSNKFPIVSFFALLIILVQVSVLAGIIPLIAFSKCEYDQEFILMFPVEKNEYIKAKILATIFFQIPIFLLITVIIFLAFDINLFYKLIAVIVVGVNIIACTMIGMDYDGKRMEFGLSLDDLSYKRIPIALGFIMSLSVLFGIFYLGPFYFTWMTFELAIVCMGGIGCLLAVYFYKKVLTIEF